LQCIFENPFVKTVLPGRTDVFIKIHIESRLITRIVIDTLIIICSNIQILCTVIWIKARVTIIFYIILRTFFNALLSRIILLSIFLALF
jgi:hypothetical protein